MKKNILLMLCTMVVLSSFIGCSKTDKTSQKATQSADNVSAESNKKLSLDVMARSYAGGGWPDDFIVIKKLNEKLNIELNIQWIPSDNYIEKVNVLAASNTFPDAYSLGPENFNRWKEKGIFVNVKPELNKYPNLVKYLDKSEYEILNPKGKYLGIPYYTITNRDPMVIRQDWLKKLNLKMPETLDDYYNVMKAFVNNDPDGNGKKDTVGISFSVSPLFEITDLDFLFGAFGLGNKWKEIDGKLVPMQVQAKELKDAIGFLRKAYEEGLVDKDFAVNKARDPWNKLEAGKSGVVYVNPFEVLQKSVPDLKKVDPNSELVQLPAPKGPTGLQGTKTSPTTEKIVINTVSSPDKQQRLLKLFDYMLSDEGYDIIKNGIEGIHYKKTGDNKYEVNTDAFDKDRPFLLSTWLLRRDDPLIQIRKYDDQEKAKIVSAWMEVNKKATWPNPAAGFDTDTNIKLGKTLQQKWVETIIKVIVGKEPINSIDKAIEDWKANGGNDIIKEMNEQYLKTK